MFHEITKHIDIQMHFIGDVIAQDAIVIIKKKIPTMDILIGMMTKIISTIKFKYYFWT